MDKETESIKGWKAWRFNFGCYSDSALIDPCERYDADIYKQEDASDGCFVTVVDYDALDNQ